MINNFKMTELNKRKIRKCTKCNNQAAVKIKVSRMPTSFLCEHCVAELFEHVATILKED